MIVLFGAEVAFANEHYETYGFQPDYSTLSVSSKKLLILRIFQLLIKNFSHGKKPLNASRIAETLEIPIRLVRQLLSELIGAGLVVETAKGAKDEAAFQPGRAPEQLTVKYALDAYEQYGAPPVPMSQSEEAEKISLYLKNISDIIENSPGNVKLREI
jgi:membrane protein